MAKSVNQKLKLLYLQQILFEKTDEHHPMGVQQMIEQLAEYDISAERKSIYDDIEALRRFGLDIIQIKGKRTGYYVASREFQLPELKLLVDIVQSSKFITQRKTVELIKKIESLASVYDAGMLQRQVYVRNRVKSMNESVYYNVDEISFAITSDKQIKFKYFEYDVSKNRHYRHDGSFYNVSPFALLWDDENYYMLAFDDTAGMLKHFRVDKMSKISSIDMAREGKEEFAKADMSTYSQKVFGMFRGELTQVRMRFANHLAGAVIDRFGKDVLLVPEDGEHFTVSAEIAVSGQFFAWIFGFGAECEILAPQNIRQEMKEYAQKVLAMY